MAVERRVDAPMIGEVEALSRRSQRLSQDGQIQMGLYIVAVAVVWTEKNL